MALRKHWRLLVGLAVLGMVLWTAGLAGFVAYANRVGCVSVVNFQRIADGMTEAEVQAILGDPGQRMPVSGGNRGDYTRQWESSRSLAVVYFDGTGHVTQVLIAPSGRHPTVEIFGVPLPF